MCDSVQFSSNQITFLDKFLNEKNVEILEFLHQQPDDGHDISNIQDKLKELFSIRDFEVSNDQVEITKSKSKSKKKKSKAKKHEIQDVSVNDTESEHSDTNNDNNANDNSDLDEVQEESSNKKPKKEKKEKKVKKEKKTSKVTGYRLYMFGIKDDESQPGKIKEIKDSDELDEFKETASSGEIHKKAFSMASHSWKNMSDEEKQVFNDKAKEINDNA